MIRTRFARTSAGTIQDKHSGRWLIIGHFGAGNVGDEAMLAGFLSAFPPHIRSRFVIATKQGVAPPVPEAAQTQRVPQRMRSILGILTQTEGVLICGGTNFHDSYSFWPHLSLCRAYFLYLGLLALARLLGNRIVWVGVGVGPLTRLSTKTFFLLSAALAEFITVRDTASLVSCRGLVRSDKVIKTFDLALLLARGEYFRAPEHPAAKRYLGVALSPLANFRGFDRQFDRRLVDNMTKVLTRILNERQELHVGIFAIGGGRMENDLSICDPIYQHLSQHARGRVRLIRSQGDPVSTLRHVSECDAFFATRYHAAVFGYIGGCDLMVFPYNRKVHDFACEVGLPRQAEISPADLDNENGLYRCVTRLLQEPELHRPTLPLNLAIERAQESVDRLCPLMEDTHFRHSSGRS